MLFLVARERSFLVEMDRASLFFGDMITVLEDGFKGMWGGTCKGVDESLGC
jgi:hypothetical protein